MSGIHCIASHVFYIFHEQRLTSALFLASQGAGVQKAEPSGET
jgi:hypothetical protein